MEKQRRLRGLPITLLLLGSILQAAVVVEAQSAQVTPAPDSQAAPPAQADQDSPSSSDQDPPGRIARVNYIDGAVSFQPGGENEWLDASLNRPLVSGDNLWADKDSRAEVHIGSTALRLAPMTGITLLEVSDHVTQIRLVQGSLIVRPRHVDSEDAYEIDTPNVAFLVMQAGDYRLDVDPDGAHTDVTVFRGRGQVTGGGSSYTVLASQHATFIGTDQVSYAVHEILPDDGFDNWALQRDRSEDDADAANYVSRDMTGYEDLDQYGDWNYVAGYGSVWSPRVVVAGWAPYRFGRWTWVGPWGWTWVADEPWGFAPFHYGRWAFVGANWVWVPGSASVRPVYAPAQVAWVGGGRGAHFSFGAGVGWVPLAPGEVFVPSYRVSRAYMNTVNLTNTHVEMTRISNVYNRVVVNRATTANDITYANRSVNGGVTVVSRETFVNSQSVSKNVVTVPAKELASVPVTREVSPEPVRASVTGAGKPVETKPPAAMMNRPVVALRTPAPMPHSLDSADAQPGAHSNQVLVRQQAPGKPVPVATLPAHPTQAHEEPPSLMSVSDGNTHAKAPRVWEEQGTPEPERSADVQTSAEPQMRRGQPSSSAHSTQQRQQPVQSAHSLPKPSPPPQPKKEQEQPSKYSSWHSSPHPSTSTTTKPTTSTTSSTTASAHK
jgi:hypothetical protein